ncbi:MAG: tandem-95 repeat protein, partial [Hormoscilla sp. GM102CHS1]|nr:tandem-95 repeat protein [Hormoscilla sp. GM102CHS1]
GTSSATVTITVPNKAPEAGNDSAIMLLGTTGTIQVLANDTDDNSDVLSVTSFSQNSDRGGTIAREGNSLHYTPAAGFHGTDSFEYSISDGNGGTDSATVMITVPNVPPDAIDDSATVSLQTAGIIRVLANDTDINHHDVLEITGFSTTSSKGSTINSDGNVLIYTPNSIGGIDSFMYSISDGNGGTSSATVTITVPNVPPDAIDDSTIVLVGTTGIIQVLENDIDANNDVLEITGFSTTSSLGGTIAREGNNLIYIPSNNTGMEILSYTITDNNGGTSSATVTIMVIPAE